MISDKKIMTLKKKMLNQKRDLQQRVVEVGDRGLDESLSSSLGELSVYDNHPGDIASEVFERSKDYSLRENSMLVLKAIENALDNIEKGTYGICEVCGADIPPERLETVPYTVLCVGCKKKMEKPKESSRPVEETVMKDVYSNPFSDGLESVESDWEDIFQKVADWNEHAARSGAGSYYGADEPITEDQLGSVEDVEAIPYEVGDDGVIYKSYRGETQLP